MAPRVHMPLPRNHFTPKAFLRPRAGLRARSNASPGAWSESSDLERYPLSHSHYRLQDISMTKTFVCIKFDCNIDE